MSSFRLQDSQLLSNAIAAEPAPTGEIRERGGCIDEDGEYRGSLCVCKRRGELRHPLTSTDILVRQGKRRGRHANRDAPSHPDELCVGDITYVRTWEGWLYLSTIIDCFSRRVIGWAMAYHLRTELPLTALHMALARRNPSGTLIHHTNRGCRYTSEAYTNVLASHGVRSSLSRSGNCWDNAVAESFFSTLKLDLLTDTAGRLVRQQGARSSSTSRVSTTVNAATQRSAISVPQTTNPSTPLCARPNKRVRQTGAGPLPLRESAPASPYPCTVAAVTSERRRGRQKFPPRRSAWASTCHSPLVMICASKAEFVDE